MSSGFGSPQRAVKEHKYVPRGAGGGHGSAGSRALDVGYRVFVIAVLRLEDGHFGEVTAFHGTGLFPAFALPVALPLTHR